MNNPYQPHHRFRFYIVMITLIIAGIFLFLLINNDSGASLTGALVGDNFGLGNNDEFGSDTSSDTDSASVETATEEESSDDITKYNSNINLALTFNQIPKLKKEAKIKEVELKFTDIDTKIKVNNEKLELNNLNEVNLKITGFTGKIKLNDFDLSLDGEGNKMEINGLALSSNGKLEISFENLNYQFLDLKHLQLETLELPKGDGSLNINQKLQYLLSGEEVNLVAFKGEMIIGQNDVAGITLTGTAKEIEVAGNNLNLNLN